ncbi:hypothetical protein [Halopseudomonas bauzanensis]|uniref:hypothetical protein n=1 Tax=Halopseudomonas bauzanensis TaxID=653930 RepID=UPI0025528966|nr:hypothetical protein [Halopseudomonas bauzanensis]
MDSSLAAGPGAAQNHQPEYAPYPRVVSRALPLLAIIVGLYISWFYDPPFYYGSGTQWLAHAGAFLVFGGVLTWSGIELTSRKYEGHRVPAVAGVGIFFLIGMLLAISARLLVYLLDPPHWPEMNITYAPFDFRGSMIAGAIGVCVYAIMLRHMHKLTLKKLPLYLLLWHVLTGLAGAAFFYLSYGLKLGNLLRFEMISYFTNGLTEAGARLLLIGGSVLGAWWLANNVKPVNGSSRQTRGTVIGDVVCDFIDNRLGLAPTFWYIGMIGGHLATLPLLILVTMNASPIATLFILVPLVLFWVIVFLRIIQTSEHYSGAAFWIVCAVIIVGAQMVSNLVGVVVISQELMGGR